MAKPVTLKLGQYLLLLVALLFMGAAGGIFAAAIHWHIHGAATFAVPVEMVGLFAFVGLMGWRTLENMGPGKPFGF